MSLKRLKPPYRNDSNQWYTSALFYEQIMDIPVKNRVIEPVFGLYRDYEGCINARKTFVELRDPTGYQWAMKYLHDYDHFKFLERSKWFKEALEIWRDELRMLQRSEAIRIIEEISKGESQQALVAAKYLAEQAWDKSTNSRGRPSKHEVKGALKKEVEALSAEDEDAKRIGLVK